MWTCYFNVHIYTETQENRHCNFEELNFSRRYRKKIKLYGKMIVNEVEVKNHIVLHKGDKLILILI